MNVLAAKRRELVGQMEDRVLDTMHARWTDRIDIYMGKDIDAAREWGKKQVTIYWN